MLCGNCQVSNFRLLTPNFKLQKNDNLWRNPSRRNHLTLFLWCQAYKSNDKRVNFSWFYVTNFFPRFSDHGAEIHTKRKVSCWKMTIRINWKMKEGVIVYFGGESNFSKRSKNSITKLFELVEPETSHSGLLRSAERYPLKRVPANSIFTAPPVHLGRLWLKSQS